MRSFIADCRHALRLYARTPVASVIAVVGFTVAVAFVAAFVALYVDLVLRPHGGFEQSGRIVTFGWSDGIYTGGLPAELIDRFGEETTTLDAAAGVARLSFRVGPNRESVWGEMVTREFFPGIRAKLALGRGFERSEHQADGEPVVVISHAYWQQQFGGSSDVLGRTIVIDGRGGAILPGGAEPQGPTEFRIVGVMDAQLAGTVSPSVATMLWMPVERALALAGNDINAVYGARSMRGIGRRSAGASATAVANELNTRYADEIGSGIEGLSNVRISAVGGLVFDIDVQRSAEKQLRLFLGASVLLAIVAAANMSLFLLARAPGRRRELGIRMSVGAPLKRIARQLATEASVLSLIAAGLGLALSVWLAIVLPGLSFLQDAQWRDVSFFDWRVLGIVGICVLALTTLVSLVPILGLKRLGIAQSSRSVAPGPSVAQRLAGAAQISIAAALGGAAIAFAWYLGTLMLRYPGYEMADRYAVLYEIPLRFDERTIAGLSVADRERRREVILSIPGVRSVSLAGMVPGLVGSWHSVPLPHPSDPSALTQVMGTNIDTHYVDVLGLELLYGRNPIEFDSSVVLVNQALARELWGRDNVVGEKLPEGLFDGGPISIVGVLADLSYEHPDAEVRPIAFSPDRASSLNGLAIVQTSMRSADLQQALQGLVESGVLELTIHRLDALKALRGELIASDRARSALTAAVAVLVVLLAGVGFYGTQRYLVMAGRREFAIRASLGAGPSAIGRLVLRRGIALGLPGLVFGLPLAFIVVARLRDDYLVQDIAPATAVVAAAVGIMVLLIGASLGPARQARRTQPAPLLKAE